MALVGADLVDGLDFPMMCRGVDVFANERVG